MPVCKFFVQGSCRYGERCWNEHPRGGQGGGRQTYDDRRQAQGGGRQTYDDRRQAQGGGRQTYDDRRQAQGGGRQTYDDRRQAPWGNEKREQHSRQPRYDEGGYYQNRNRQQQYYHGDNYNSHQQNYYEDPGSRRNDSKSDPSNKFNKYHWNRENRFGALQEEPKSETSPEIIISTIQKDIKVWIESKMWPYSCYSYTRGARCIEGLADISPEEIRVLAYLHQSQYGTVIEEINRTYNRTKEELFEMSQSVKSDILSNLNSPIESNPSSDLKILELYGPQFNFESDSKAEPAQEPLQQSFSFITEQAKSNAATAIPSGSFNSNSGAFDAALPAAAQKPVCSPVANSISVFGVKNTEKNSPFASGKDSGVYTPYDLLTEGEKKQFEADRFIAGQIPTRPPSEQFCQ